MVPDSKVRLRDEQKYSGKVGCAAQIQCLYQGDERSNCNIMNEDVLILSKLVILKT